MRNKKIARTGIAAFIMTASLLFAFGAMAATENECINGGGHVAAGSGCKFCVGGKFDLSEIRDAAKNDVTHSGADQKTGEKTSGQPGTKAAAGSRL